MKVRWAPLIFVFCLCTGLWITERSWNGRLFVYVGEDRGPTAVHGTLEYSALDRGALYRSAHNQLLDNAEIIKSGKYAGVRFGHPLIAKEKGGKAFGCQVADHRGLFNQIEITFIGTGISEGGSPARMVVEAPCRAIRDLNKLETVWIPMGDIFASAPKDQELQIFGESPVVVKLEEIPSQWPTDWVLWSVRLYRDDDPDEALFISSKLIKESQVKKLSFDWQPSAAQ